MLPFMKNHSNNGSDHWISLSDIMTALMMVFLLISIIYMIRVKESVDIPRIFKADEQQLYSQLKDKLTVKLNKWGATLSPDLTVRFSNEDILFKAGSSDLQPEFKKALDEYFPDYLRSLMQAKFIDNIKEIRIEGHTSSFWAKGASPEVAYINNMQLSQQRAQNTLIYLLKSDRLTKSEKEWLKIKFRAIGYSSAATLGKDGKPSSASNPENFGTSQRVEFRVVTTAEDKIRAVAYGNK
ncbi:MULTISPECIES: OmpA/MotB family protein [Acinetobacter]|uniref:OmpA family protein n=1 Tax=Acinetobacter variabilis TaxID=70346 RepID=A0A7T7WLF3_9GAMM|nr:MULTISPECIES: OmpA family protein [Acinetobacter]MDM1786632.1 OmpA family protein [Acinetobacter bereziniae]NHB64296.1 OmpA family protein [Acinetobacter sp. GFQ9D191M]NHC00560.1 OmpA family protein [Acinetobacter sp. GFQ9D192M]QQN89122.1 OmpA family protein [Acinetobacter variabilis]